MTTVTKTISSEYLTLIETAFRKTIDEIKEMSNNKLILYKDINSTNMYYIVGEYSSFKLGNYVKLNIEYPEFYFQDENHMFVLCDSSDVELINKPTEEKVEKKKETNIPDIELLTKMTTSLSKMYQLQPNFFLMKFKELKSDVMLHDKMLKLYPGYDERKLMYAAVDFVKKQERNKVHWKIAVGISSNYYKVDFNQLVSLRQTYNSTRRI